MNGSHLKVSQSLDRLQPGWSSGFAMIELILVLAIVGTLSALALPLYVDYLEKTRVGRAIAEVRYFEKAINLYETDEGTLPLSLADLGGPIPLDPWGNPYEYLNHSTVMGPGPKRKDMFLVPINSDYDLYSKGKDGNSLTPLQAAPSWDDIVRGADGGFVGLATQF